MAQIEEITDIPEDKLASIVERYAFEGWAVEVTSTGGGKYKVRATKATVSKPHG